jgi:hypothetical protein
MGVKPPSPDGLGKVATRRWAEEANPRRDGMHREPVR